MAEDDLARSIPHFSSEMQLPQSTRKRRRSDDEIGLENVSKARDKIEYILITHIRVTNVVTKLRRIPVGFYVGVKSENVSKRTLINPVSVGKDIVEWDDRIVLPSDRSSRISFTVFASFELGHILGNGEILCIFEVTLGEMLDRNGQLESVRFCETSNGEVLTSRSSFEIEIERRDYGQDELSAASDLPESKETRQLGELTDKGHCALVRYRELEEERDLDESIKYFEHARDSCPLSHPSRDTVLFNLATAKLMYCRVNDAFPDLDVAIDLYRTVLCLRPHGHPDHPFTLLNLGVALQARFQRQGAEADEEEGKAFLSQVLDAVQMDSYAYHAAILALYSTARPELIRMTEGPRGMEDDPDGDDDGVDRLDVALQSIFFPDPSSHDFFDHLGILFCIRLDRLDELADPEKEISILEAIVKFTPDNHPDRPSWLNNLSISFWTRYEHFGDTADLAKSISMKEDAVRLTPDDDTDKPRWISDLCKLLLARYERFGDVVDLEKSISMAEEAVRLTPDGDPDKPGWLNNLGNSLWTRYECLSSVVDLKKSISMHVDAVRLTSDDDPYKPGWLNTLGNSLLTRYMRFGDTVDLERSISTHEDAVRLTPDGHPDKPESLNSLGNSLLIRHKRCGDVSDLEKSMSMNEEAVRLTADGHPDKPLRLGDLGQSLLARYERFGDVADLGKSTSMKEEAVRLTTGGDSNKPVRLNNLGESLLARYKRFGDITDLERSISVHEDAVRLTPDCHPDKPIQLNNLGNSLSTRFEHFGDIVDLEKSISMHEGAVRLTPDGRPDKSLQLNNLGNSLLTRYEYFGDVGDLEKSISILEDAVRLTPDGDLHKPARLSNLGNSLWTRYGYFGDVIDLEKLISMREAVVQLTPDGHPDKPLYLNNLGNSLSTRFERFRDVVDLERSISIHEDAVRLTSDGHPYKPGRLNDLGNSLLIRFEHFADVVDLQKSISRHEDAVRLTADGHPDKPGSLNNLCNSLLVRYQHSGDVVDLEKSISMNEEAVRLTADGHPDKPLWLSTLARSLLKRFQRSSDSSSSDLPRAISYSSQAACSYTGPSADRFRASQLWIQCVRLLQHDSQSLLDAYTVAVHLLPQMAWIGLPLHDRYHQLLRAADTACDAAASALKANRPELAVEWLEQGRSIVWSQLSQLRTPIDDLRNVHPKLAAQFEQISQKLEYAAARDRTTVNEFTSHSKMKDESLEERAQQHHALALSRERLLSEIRALPSFERFLLPRTMDQLSPLARSGPVVFLNASRHGCDALIVMLGSERVVHVPLLNANYDQVAGMQLRLSKLLTLNDRVILRDMSDRGAKIQGTSPEEVFGSILPYLWDRVVSPILEVLAVSTSDPKLTRVFWCATGPFSFLPIHAAGHYSTTNPGPKLSDFVVSSYIPTMSVLELPPQEDSQATLSNICLLAVRQPSTDGQVRLTGVQKEMEVIRNLASSSPFVGFQEVDGTVEDVLEKMKASHWVHFACHGTQDRANPLDSGLQLAHSRRLKVSDIVGLSRPRGGLAFLSACQTATGDETLTEESIHIAAGMLLAGYRGVIATMWSIMDNDAPRVAEDVYKSLFRDGKVPDSREAAEALHHAIERLRDSGAPFLSWVPFIHVGL